MRHPPLLFLAATAIGCGKGSLEESACRKEAEALGALLAEANVDPPQFYLDGIKLPLRTDLPRAQVAWAPEVLLRNGEVSLRGQRVVDKGDLVQRLTVTRAKLDDDRMRGTAAGEAPDPQRIFFAIDEATPWREVVDAVQAAEEAGFRAPAFVFAAPAGTAKPPPRSSIDDDLDAILKVDATERATRFAKLVERQVASCPSLVREFGRTSGVAGEDKATTLIKAIPEALVQCRCQVEIPALRSAMWRLLWNPTPTRVIAFDPAAPAGPLAFPGATRWADASRELLATTKRATFAVQ